MNKQSQQTNITRISREGTAKTDDLVAIEEPLEIQLCWSTSSGRMQKTIAITMRTPGNEAELAAGFLFTEGIIKEQADIGNIKTGYDENKILVILKENIVPRLQHAERNFYTTSSCGICGKSSIEAITTSITDPPDDKISIDAEILHTMPTLLKEKQQVFEETGGLHACALFTLQGDFISLKEDIGRHNALDKLIGSQILNNVPLGKSILFLSGRAGFELIQKAAVAGIRIVAAVGAPSSLAVELAKEMNITLAGFVRGGRYNIYSGSQRIKI